AAPPPSACAHCRLSLSVRCPPPVGARLYCCLGCRLAAAAGAGDDGPRRFLEARLVFSAFLAMGVMAANLVLYGEDVYARGDEPGLAVMRRLAQIGCVVFAAPVLLLLGAPLLRGAWLDLKRGVVRMDGLIVLATLAAFAVSVQHTIAGEGPVYYETAVVVLTVVMFGRRLEAHARSEARDAASAIADLLPAAARRLRADGTEEEVAPDALRAGDRVRVAPGAAFPADVRILEGRGACAASHVTGESAAVAVGPGDDAPAGAVNGAAALEAEVVRPWREGPLGRIRALLDAPVPLTRVIRTTDRLAGRLAWLSVALALAGGIRSGLEAGAGEGVRTALSVLLCACPCALGLAVPLSYRAMRTALARRGVLVHDPAALENALNVGRALVDKTGTLTEPLAAHVDDDGGADGPPRRLAALVAASGHPLARAFGREASTASAPKDVVLLPGRGVRGRFGDVDALAGDPGWLDGEGATWPAPLAAARDRHAEAGRTLVAYAENGAVRALAAVEHRLRASARDVVAALAERGVTTEIVSGDRPRATADVAAALGAPYVARATPDDKAARVRELARRGVRVLAVGDGVNDAPFLRAADVGVAVASGAAAARSEAQVELVADDLRGLVTLLDGAKALARNVRGNLFWTLAYNGAALAFAAAGKLHPLIAVAAMTGSSLAVAFRAHRLLSWGADVGGAPAAVEAPRSDVDAPRGSTAQAAVLGAAP
ncbi:MAG TPA: heavy metal translocating P-type ATPase, partial [Planctomycetota bacterium]|nr:heavy metal translocating P-type ATPase [Planctomycetota bacterium]